MRSTIELFVSTILRRWYITLPLVVITGLLVMATPRDPGTYWGRTDVYFLPPSGVGPDRQNVLQDAATSITYFAAAVERKVVGHPISGRLASSDAGLYGTGLDRGYTVTLANKGSQWGTNFNKPVLIVEAVAPDPEGAAALLEEAVGRVYAAADEAQRRTGTGDAELITLERSPASIEISHVPGSRKRAQAALLALGLGASLGLTLGADWILRTLAVRRQRRRHEALDELSGSTA
ncbi:hypothetical protein E8D34_20355 [Nocardioides sp. GY 10113]|uniref:hypothetical protein n=1 Tax=Nocardioides sp. GY 10113 TaxID=2569761 RepID=UPI0010A8F1F7|nr:hypothetical protein [Nocardioides sp. GY 10113]TIC79528.1 hypothetical protein E8D34_20355 [Nocardioides sp. GY 10113]